VELANCAGPADFLERAGPLLLADEARHNLPLGIAATLRETPDYYPEAHFWVVEDGGAVVGAALLTPPHNLVLARPSAPTALDVLVGAMDDELPGVTGARPEAEEFAALWVAARGGSHETRTEMRIHALAEVRDDGSASGGARRAGPADRDVSVEWWTAFTVEAVRDGHTDHAAAAVDHRLTGIDGGILLWEDRGDVVSLAGYGGPTPNGIRIGPVYTPPELRGRGYATSLVAVLSRQLLADGRRFCFLYTDLSNPTSNRIYARIGYEPVCDSAEIAFTPG